MEEILMKEKQILLLKEKLKNRENGNWIMSCFSVSFTKKNIQELEADQFYLVHNFLYHNDIKYKGIVKENIGLLVNNDLKFTVYAHNYSLGGTYTTSMGGNIAKNGFSYLYRGSTNFFNSLFSPFAQYGFPSEMEGTIDCFGNIDLETTKVGYRFLRTLPKQLIGEIDEYGNIHIKTVKNETDFFRSGKMVIGKVICNHFRGKDKDRITFHNNRVFLRRMIREFREEIADKFINGDAV